MTVNIVNKAGEIIRTVYNVRAIHALEHGFELALETSDDAIKIPEQRRLLVTS